MICIFSGPTPNNLIAGDVQKAVEAQVSLCEHDPTLQERKKGLYRLEMRTERPPGKKLRLPDGGIAETIEDEVTAVVGRTRVTQSPRKVRFSPMVTNISLTDFPENWSFGNGVTCNVMVPMRDGTVRCLSWAVFPDASESTVNGKFDTLRQLMER